MDKRVIAAWITIVATLAAALGILFGLTPGKDGGAAPNSLPSSAESAHVQKIIDDNTTATDAPLLAIVTRSDGRALTRTDMAGVLHTRDAMLKVDRHVDSAPPLIPSKDGKAAMVMIPITTEASGTQLGDIVTNVRDAGHNALLSGLKLHTTGGPAFGADAGNVFKGADFRLLAITAAVVAVLLLLTYRSPILWLFPLIVVGIADRVAALIAETSLLATGFSYDGSTGGIISVLVFGAGANYALLFTSRYRDELQQRENKLDALTVAWKGSFPAVLASNLTVVGALLMLLFADSPAIRNLGAGGPIGLLVALVAILLVLPAVYAIMPRWIFWPLIPKPKDANVTQATDSVPAVTTRAHTPTQQGADDATPDNRWYHIAQKVQKRPVTTLLAGGVILIVLACGMIGTTFGLSQTEQFTTQTESVDGLHILEEHYSAGMASPITIIAKKQNARDVHRILDASNDVASVRPAPLDIGNWMRWTVIGKNEPSTPGALDTITNLRTQLGNKALVGGADAESYDQANTTRHDLKVAIPLILLVVFLMLVIVLRALVTPILMALATTISAVAAFGLGSFVSHHIFNFPALDYTTPIYSFLFLVALGVDYSIFLVVRAKQLTPAYGTKEAMARAVAYTGGVITSAGIVLAAVFVVLGVLPLIAMAQCGIIVSLGVLLDTFLVRTLLIPAIFTTIGDLIWWPNKLARGSVRTPEPTKFQS